MIVQCENCASRFNLDESLLKEDGSKVRCSQCRSVFLVLPPSPEPPDLESAARLEEAPEETVILDAPPDLAPATSDSSSAESETQPEQASLFGLEEPSEVEEMSEEDFDLAFEDDLDASVDDLEEPDEIEALSPGDLPDVEEETTGMEDALEQASEIEERITVEESQSTMQAEEPSGPLETPVRGPGRRPRSALLPVLLGLVLLLMAAGAGIFFFAPGLIPGALDFVKPGSERTAADPGVKRLSFKGVKGTFVRTGEGNQRFVIRGIILNNYPDPRSFIRVKASILDEKGKTVRSRTAYAGNDFVAGDLVGRPMTFLENRMGRRAGENNNNVAIASGGEVPFMVVFQNLPKDISEFTVEAVSSSPADRS